MSGSCPGRSGAVKLLALAVLAQAGVAHAQQPVPEPSPLPPPKPAIAINGFASVAYVHNFNDPPSGANQFRIFDFTDGTFKIDVVELVVQRTTPVKSSVGFRIDAEAGGSIPRGSAASGLFRDSRTGEAGDFDLQQAFVTWVTPLGRGLRVDAGKFISHCGLELIEGYDGWNDEYSRAFIFGYAMPGTTTGVKLSYPLSNTVTLMALATQGWDNFKDNNDGKSLGAQLAVVPSPRLSLYLNYIGGPERARSSDRRDLLDVVLVVKPSPRVAFGFNGDLATEENGAGPGRDAKWNGFAGYVRLGLSPRLALSLRGERFEDTDGARTGVAQTLSAGTATLEYKVGHGFVVRGEVRRDHSSQPVFDATRGPVQGQTTLAGNVVYAF